MRTIWLFLLALTQAASVLSANSPNKPASASKQHVNEPAVGAIDSITIPSTRLDASKQWKRIRRIACKVYRISSFTLDVLENMFVFSSPSPNVVLLQVKKCTLEPESMFPGISSTYESRFPTLLNIISTHACIHELEVGQWDFLINESVRQLRYLSMSQAQYLTSIKFQNCTFRACPPECFDFSHLDLSELYFSNCEFNSASNIPLKLPIGLSVLNFESNFLIGCCIQLESANNFAGLTALIENNVNRIVVHDRDASFQRSVLIEGFSNTTCIIFSSTDFVQLEHLTIADKAIDESVLDPFVAMKLPKLQSLVIKSHNFDLREKYNILVAFVEQVMGTFPSLQHFEYEGVKIDFETDSAHKRRISKVSCSTEEDGEFLKHVSFFASRKITCHPEYQGSSLAYRQFVQNGKGTLPRGVSISGMEKPSDSKKNEKSIFERFKAKHQRKSLQLPGYTPAELGSFFDEDDQDDSDND